MDMEGRWTELCKRLGRDIGASIPYRFVISARYNERREGYHNLSHIEHCLLQLDSAGERIAKPDEAETALWFHDLIYSPGDKKNEKDSADTAKYVLESFQQPNEFILRVQALIILTKHDKLPDEKDNDARYVLDIDLSGLGKPEEQFVEDEKKLRREYARFSNEQFKQMFAECFLAKPRIFLTDFFASRYEAQARKNLQDAVSRLSGKK